MSGNGLQVALRHRFAAVQGDAADPFCLRVEFTAEPGFTILFGPSGSGKTTVFDCIAGLIAPEQGKITAAGRALFDSSHGVNVPTRRRRIGYVLDRKSVV